MIFEPGSLLMKTFRILGMRKLATSARRLYCPVSPQGLVLDVGSGDSPYPRSDVLLDISFNDYERGGSLYIDRPLVLGLAERMPFKDKAFEFSVASHVLEHSSEPKLFLQELQRISSAGYIETPGDILELLDPNRSHRLFVFQNHNYLVITKKATWNAFPTVATAWSHLIKRNNAVRKFLAVHEIDMMVKYYWNGSILYEITNDEVDCSWYVPHPTQLMDRGKTRSIFRELMRVSIYRLARKRRKRDISWKNILRCVDCFAADLEISDSKIKCKGCGRMYEVKNGVPVMLPENYNWD
jgi:uncharacterized protein YbaR (Trm112 family)